jgi:ribonuclease BN (tRNA processing enzyme)
MMLRIGYLPPERLPFGIQYESLGVNQKITIGGIAITPYPTTHLKGHAETTPQGGLNRCECFAFRILLNSAAIVYSSDLGKLSDLNQIQDPINWLLIETSHVDLDLLWPWAEARGVKRIILTHLSDDFDPGAIAAAPKYTTAEIMIAEDGMTLPVS